MKDSHIYKRMNEPRIYKGYVRMIRESSIDVAKALLDNITTHASDHPKYQTLIEIYQQTHGTKH